MERPAFMFDGGHLALDFLNTVASPDGEHEDVLSAPATLLAWLEAAGLLTRDDLASLRASPPEARLLLRHADRLRAAVAAMVRALVTGVPMSRLAVVEVNGVLARRRVGLMLSSADQGRRLASVQVVERPVGLLAPVAEAAARLLLEADPARVRRCAAPACALWFLDTSRNGRRRWCSMARCGNRAKVAAHYRRQLSDTRGSARET